MPIIIKQRAGGGLEVFTMSRGDWDTCKTALEWKKSGLWKKVKNFVYFRQRNHSNRKKGWFR